jgi:hypothetical protein
MAVGLVIRGADRVIAMQAPVRADYATALTAALYRRLAERPDDPVDAALTAARREVDLVARTTAAHSGALPYPGYAVPTLFAAGPDLPLIDPGAPPKELSRPQTIPSGTSVRELQLGQLIGRRAELRTATAVLRRTRKAVDRHGAAAGVLLRGVGGIGKTAIAGRVMTRLADDGWTVAVHTGAWNPGALFEAVADGLEQPRSGGPTQLAGALQSAEVTEPAKLDLICQLLSTRRLLLVLDDFEQNLAAGGTAFTDPAVAVHLTRLAEAATTGGLLVTCRYPLPDDDRLLVDLPVASLSPAELRRLFLRMPALSALDADDRTVIARTIGGHPRLIEFADALLRGGAVNLRDAANRLRRLARANSIDLTRPRRPDEVLDDVVVLGSTDILLEDLLSLLTTAEAAAITQLAVCRAPITADDLAHALTGDNPPGSAAINAVHAAAQHFADLTLLDTAADGILLHPWIGAGVLRLSSGDTSDEQHRRAATMHLRRFRNGSASYGDLLDLPRHLAALGDYDQLVAVAQQGAQVIGGTLAAAGYLGELRPLIPAPERASIVLGDLEMNALLAAGDLAAAAHVAEANHTHIETRAAADPSNTQWQRDLSVSHERLGDVAVAGGDLAGAAEHYRAGLTIAERLVAADPSNTEWQRDLSVSHSKLGDVAVAGGDLAGAAEHYRAGLTIAERLAAADPSNTQWQRDLTILRERLTLRHDT